VGLDLTASPAWFPLRRVSGTRDVDLIRLDEAAYRAASFLDERILLLKYEHRTCGSEILEAAAVVLPRKAHYIFHTGHAGSTLVSRLIGENQGLFSLREPALLRALADDTTHRPGTGPPSVALNLDATLRLLSRTWRPAQRTVVKATSIANELVEFILSGADRPAAIFMFTDPLAYLRGILAGPNSRVESRTLGPARLRRLIRRLAAADWSMDPRSEGAQVAMNWLCEMTALHQAALRFGSQVLWVNFDVFLADPNAGLRAIFAAFGAAASDVEIEALATGPLMRQYSKAPQHAYDAALRREVLMSADWEHGVEIKHGMEWLNQTALRYPLARAVLDSTASARTTP
jgi:hypothetical protein